MSRNILTVRRFSLEEDTGVSNSTSVVADLAQTSTGNQISPSVCPDPKPKITPFNNCVVRCDRRAMGYHSKSLDTNYIHSRFCPVRTFRRYTRNNFTCATFSPDNNSVIVGHRDGKIRIFDLHNKNNYQMFETYYFMVRHLQPHRNGELLLTGFLASVDCRSPFSVLWELREGENAKMKFALEDEDYAEFSKVSQDKIVGTRLNITTIYDSYTGQTIMHLIPNIRSYNPRNKATFSPSDDVVLSAGVLFDPASGQQIHKLEGWYGSLNCMFHPSGLEILSDSEIWDMRTFRVIKTVPELYERRTIFSPVNNGIYTVPSEHIFEMDFAFEATLTTFDANDYSKITTIDMKKDIYTLAVNSFDTQIVIVQNEKLYRSIQDSTVKIYDVGRKNEDNHLELSGEDEDLCVSDDENLMIGVDELSEETIDAYSDYWNITI